MNKKRRIRTRTVYAVEWWDIEKDAGWEETRPIPVLVVSVGFIVERPNRGQECRHMKLADTWAEADGGGVCRIPAGVIESVAPIGKVRIPWR